MQPHAQGEENDRKILGHSIVYYATWMDEWRAEPGYEHTSAWHTASVDKNLVYAPRPKGDVIFALEDAIAKLQDYNSRTTRPS